MAMFERKIKDRKMLEVIYSGAVTKNQELPTNMIEVQHGQVRLHPWRVRQRQLLVQSLANEKQANENFSEKMFSGQSGKPGKS